MFFGYYLSAAAMVREENGPAVPELARRMTLCSCNLDPARALVPVLLAMPAERHRPRRHPGRLRLRPPRRRRLGHPAPRTPAPSSPGPAPPRPRPRGTHHGAIIANGNLYCPARPHHCWNSGRRPPAPPRGKPPRTTADGRAARHKPGRISADDADGYHRVTPRRRRKIRCPLRPGSMNCRGRPEILTPPGHPPACCTQQTITVPAAWRPRPGRNTTNPQRTPPLLRPAHRRRADLLHDQGPGRHQHRPRLVPPDRHHPAQPVANLPARRPQPAHPHHIGHPPGRHPRRAAPGPPPKTRKRRRQTPTILAASP